MKEWQENGASCQLPDILSGLLDNEGQKDLVADEGAV